jgi:hypothetical protein
MLGCCVGSDLHVAEFVSYLEASYRLMTFRRALVEPKSD